MRTHAVRAALATGALAILLGGVLAGCGTHRTPADEVPALQGRLDAVDRAVADGQPGAVRRAVARLERATRDAERSGDLAHGDATAIVSAGEAVVAALPAHQPAPTTTAPTPTPSPSEHTEPPGHDRPDKGPKPPKPPKPEPHGPHGPPKGPGHDEGHDKGHGHEH